jgi:chromate reductase
MPALQQPEAYLADSSSLFDGSGRIKNQDTVQYLQGFVNAFLELIERYQLDKVPVY